MNARRRKKTLLLEIWVYLCQAGGPSLDPTPWADLIPCLHDSGQECRAQARHERRVLGQAGFRGADRHEIRNLILWNQPPSLWMGNGARHHRRYRNRSKRR